MTDEREIFYRKNSIEEIIIDILTYGECNSFFKPSIMHMDDKKIMASYNVSNYMTIEEAILRKDKDVDITCIFSAILEAVIKAQSNFIFEDNYELTYSNVYINNDFSKIKFLYIPKNNQGKDYFLKELINFFENKGKIESNHLISKIKEIMENKYTSIKTKQIKIDKLKAEIEKTS